VQCAGSCDGRLAGPALEECAQPARGNRTERHDPPARSQNAEQLANETPAIVRSHLAEEPACVVDDRDIEGAILDGKRAHGRDFHFDEHPGLGGTLTCALG
jgi:hypothetical protein